MLIADNKITKEHIIKYEEKPYNLEFSYWIW